MTNEREDLPTIDEIHASTQLLNRPGAYTRVVRFGDDLVVKHGRGVLIREAETLEFVTANSSCPAPKCLAAFSDSQSGETFIVMDFVPGKQLDEMWPTLNSTEKVEIGDQIHDILQNLRQLASPGYLSTVGENPFVDGVFWTEEEDPQFSGPFASEDALDEAIIRHLEMRTTAPYATFLRTLIKSSFQGHETCFTHGDLQPKNIMVQRTGSKENGDGIFGIVIIDWEMSGWYPEYWEFCNSVLAGRFKPDWLEVALRIMRLYTHEYSTMQLIRSILFY